MTNEVYQKNIYTDQPFMSAYKELKQMGETYVSGLEVISFHSTPLHSTPLHSTSKGLLGECRLRGRYAHFHNIDKGVW